MESCVKCIIIGFTRHVDTIWNSSELCETEIMSAHVYLYSCVCEKTTDCSAAQEEEAL